MLARIAELYPNVTELDFGSIGAIGLLPLAALPDGCWPAAASVSEIAAAAVPQLVRVCPALQEVVVEESLGRVPAVAELRSAGAALCAALESLEAVAPTLRGLTLQASCLAYGPGAAAHAGAALARLRGLRQLSVIFRRDMPGDGSALLAAAMPALSALTALWLRAGQASLNAWPCALPLSLVELVLLDVEDAWFVTGLQASPPLTNLTRLHFAG